MVFLHRQNPSRKRPSDPSVSNLPPPKLPKSAANEAPPSSSENIYAIDKMASILADAGCTLNNPSGPPCLPSDLHKLRSHLHRLFSAPEVGPSLRSHFLAGFSSYIDSPKNLQRVLVSSNQYCRSESLVRQLLMVPSIQVDLQMLLLQKLPEYFDVPPESSLEEDSARLIINQFRWIDFMVDSNAFCDRLMQVLSICPLHLKKEIIGSLPEIIGDQNTKAVVDSLGQLLQEDSSVIVPVLDCFSNFNLDESLQEQVVTIAMSYISTIDGEHMPHLLRFLLLLATPLNVRRIVSQIRMQLKFIGTSNSRKMQHKNLKGKSLVGNNTEASILDALRTSLLFKKMLRQEILKALVSLERPQDHKVLDLWLLVLIYMNGVSMQKSIQKIVKKKIVDNCIQKNMVDQCICGNEELVQNCFPSFLSISEYLLASREQKAREFGARIYTCLFEELGDTYFRQEVLSALITHLGTGVCFEVNSSLEALAFLAYRYARELIPLSTHINGILDYLEGFNIENLHKVYEIFSHLALFARSQTECFGSSFGNEIFMIIRKQVNHPDPKYKMMGLIGTLKIISHLADVDEVCGTSSQKTNCKEAMELLRTTLDSCKQLCLPLGLFYDELTVILEHKKLNPAIMEWIAKYVGEFESIYLSDLDSGQFQGTNLYGGLEGELWMNLDGDISPICLSIFPSVSSTLQSMTSLQILPAYFLLLSTVERLTNQESLGGIDALLGCPLHLPSSKYFSVAGWQSLTTKQKEILCLSLYYAANWMRELINAFSTQVTQEFQCISQATKEDMIAKLLKRLRNLVFLESLLNNCIQWHPMSLPDLHFDVLHVGTSLLDRGYNIVYQENKNEHKKTQHTASPSKRKNRKVSKSSSRFDTTGKLCKPKISDVLKKREKVTSQQVLHEDSCGQSSKSLDSADQESNCTIPLILEAPAGTRALNSQRYKFRPLLVQCFSLLELSNKNDPPYELQKQELCCSDPAAELPLYLFLWCDLHNKLDTFTSGKQIASKFRSSDHGFSRMTTEEFLKKIRPLFPCLRKHFDSAVSTLKDGNDACEEHWKVHSAFAGNPEIADIFSRSSVSILLCKEVLHCLSKMLNLPQVQMEKAVISDLLEAFQPSKISDSVFSTTQPCAVPGTMEYLYLGVASFLEDVLDTACSFSFILASESLLTLESMVSSVQTVLDKLESTGKDIESISVHSVLQTLRNRLGSSAQKLLRHSWRGENLENGWKNKGEMIQKVLFIYLENCESKSDLLEELACNILPQISPSGRIEEDHGFQTLCNETFVVWYHVLHEANLASFNNLVKDAVLRKSGAGGEQLETVEKHLLEIQRSVNVVVSLINICRSYDKVNVHTMAIKYGGKFVDSFLKVFDFLQAHFQRHNELVIQLVLELQLATRTIQTICSEAKGLKQIAITSKIPCTKRSIECFLFRVKALLHTAPTSACRFWMGNLKHKNLMGKLVSSQIYADEEDEHANADGDLADDEYINNASEQECGD